MLLSTAAGFWGFGSSSIGVSLPIHVMLLLLVLLTRKSGGAISPSPSTPSPSSSFFNSTQFCSFNFFESTDFCCSTSTQCRFSRLGERGLTTHCPCQLKTGPVSSRQIQMSIVRTPLFASSFIIVPSREFRTCGFFSSSTTMIPAQANFLY